MTVPQLQTFFATPVITEELDDVAALNAALEASITTRMASDAGVQLSNRGGWQSTHDLTAWAGDAGARLVDHAAALASAHTTSSRGDAGLAWSIDAWANVGAAGAANRVHVHGGAFWSTVYYVSVGDGEGGELVLHDPRLPGLLMHAPELHFKGAGPELSVPIKPRAGLMVLFPAWLSHSVEPWEGSEPRISIAMNIRAASARAAARRPEAPTLNISLKTKSKEGS
jgi:uncharacterized protein (TIGR02466 family)